LPCQPLQFDLLSIGNDNALGREAFFERIPTPADSLRHEIVYDVAHNVAKVESHMIDGRDKEGDCSSKRRNPLISGPAIHDIQPADTRTWDNPF